MTIKEAVRRSIFEFLREDIKDSKKDVDATNKFIKDDKKKRDKEREDTSDKPDRGPEYGEKDPVTKVRKALKKGKEKREKNNK